MKPVQKLFSQLFYRVQKTGTYNPEWFTGCGHFDGAVSGPHALKLNPTEVVKFTTTVLDCDKEYKRRFIAVGTRLGTYLVLETRTLDIAWIASQEFYDYGWVQRRFIDEDDLKLLLGDVYTTHLNLGYRIEEMWRAMNRQKLCADAL